MESILLYFIWPWELILYIINKEYKGKVFLKPIQEEDELALGEMASGIMIIFLFNERTRCRVLLLVLEDTQDADEYIHTAKGQHPKRNKKWETRKWCIRPRRPQQGTWFQRISPVQARWPAVDTNMLLEERRLLLGPRLELEPGKLGSGGGWLLLTVVGCCRLDQRGSIPC